MVCRISVDRLFYSVAFCTHSFILSICKILLLYSILDYGIVLMPWAMLKIEVCIVD